MGSREERFRRIYEMGRARVIAYALRRTSNAEDAADVVSETFAIAWRRLDAVPDGEHTIPWLYAVARRVIANGIRRASHQSAVVGQLAHELTLPNPRADVDADRLAALNALGHLSEEDREILMLVAWEGLTSKQLGWALGCSATAARIRLHRARTRLTQAWEDKRLIPSTSSLLKQEPTV